MDQMQRQHLFAPGDDDANGSAALSAATARNPQRGRRIMRQMPIAAAIAAGLIALWAALLPLAA